MKNRLSWISMGIATLALAQVQCASLIIPPGENSDPWAIHNLNRKTEMEDYDAQSAHLNALPIGANAFVYRGERGPLSYTSPSPLKGIKGNRFRTVNGKTCQRGIVFPLWLFGFFISPGVIWGEAGFNETYGDLVSKIDEDDRVFDIKTDYQLRSFLGFYVESCTLMQATIATLLPKQ